LLVALATPHSVVALPTAHRGRLATRAGRRSTRCLPRRRSRYFGLVRPGTRRAACRARFSCAGGTPLAAGARSGASRLRGAGRRASRLACRRAAGSDGSAIRSGRSRMLGCQFDAHKLSQKSAGRLTFDCPLERARAWRRAMEPDQCRATVNISDWQERSFKRPNANG
jgi:hypothetical protein